MEFILFEKLQKITWYQWLMIGAAVAAAAVMIVLLVTRRKKTQKTDVRALTFGALCVSLSFILSYIKLFSAPQGGSVTLASMLPIMLYASMFGTKRGLLAGLVYGLLQFIQKPEIYHWAQVLLDYPLAFTVIGLAGLPGDLKLLPVGTIIGGFARFVVHTISGFLFFSEVLNGSALWASAVYNGWYMLFDTLICLVLSFPVVAIVRRTGIAPKKKAA